MTGHRAWLIDLDGTLYRSRPVKLAMAVELLTGGPEVWRVIREFRKQHEAIREGGSDAADDQFMLQVERTALSLSCSVEHVHRVVREWMFERPGPWLKRFPRERLIKQIREFRAHGGRTALVSDYPALAKLQAMGVEDLFDIVVASGELDGPSELKPAPDGYLLAASRLKVSPEECLVIGDRQDADGMAALYAGMEFCHVRDTGRLQTRPVLACGEKSVASDDCRTGNFV